MQLKEKAQIYLINKKIFNKSSSKNLINNELRFNRAMISNMCNEYNLYSGLNLKYKFEESKDSNFNYSFRKEKVKYNSVKNTS